MTGLHLAHYRIDEELGRGGMGIVYKATDTKLNRTVALKVLPAAALASDDDRARFFREAQAAAQLSHPHVCHVYQVDEALPSQDDGNPSGSGDGPRPFIAMEFVEGETLAERIARGPLKLSEAVSIAAQVAEALKTAHAKGIVHRDVKSANVMLTPASAGAGSPPTVKVLDFGLAKTQHSTKLTQLGSTLGTVAYMSPEQARGQEVDGRTDLYSLGTVLYEMIAGRVPFEGDYEQAVLYGILNEAPEPLTALRTGVPPQLEWIVDKLLAKEAEYRYQTAADLLADLKTVDLSGSGRSRRSMAAVSAVQMPAVTPTRAMGLPTWMWTAMVLTVGVVALATGWLLRPAPPPPAPEPVVRFSIELPGGNRLNRTGRRAVTISPDGGTIAYVTDRQINLLHTDDLENAIEITGLGEPREIFFSPDGEWIAYENTDDDRLMRVRTSGGGAVPVTGLPGGLFQAEWNEDGWIYLCIEGGGIGRVSWEGGTLEMLREPTASGVRYQGPRMLPDGRSLLYSFHPNSTEGSWEIRMLDLETGQDVRLIERGRDVTYLESGFLVYYAEESLFAVRFDPARRAIVGGAIPVASAVIARSYNPTGVVQYSIAGNGTLVKARGEDDESLSFSTLSILGQDGSLTNTSAPDANYVDIRISPTGESVAVQREGEGIWIMDAVRWTAVRIDAIGESPIWSPDGTRIAYGVPGAIVVREPSQPERVDTLYTSDQGILRPSSWSPDGATILFDETVPNSYMSTLFVLDLATGEAREFFSTEEDIDTAVLSPDGRWVAYDSNELGGDDTAMMRRFPDASDRVRISPDGGEKPVWSPDGRFVYYLRNLPAGLWGLYRAEVDVTGDRPVIGPEQEVTTTLIIRPPGVFPDGRLLLPSHLGEQDGSGGTVLDIAVHWTDSFTRSADRR